MDPLLICLIVFPYSIGQAFLLGTSGRREDRDPFLPRPDKKQDQKRSEHQQTKQYPKDDKITCRAIVNRARHYRAREASPHIEETHHAADCCEIAPAEKISHSCPDDRERGVQKSERRGKK